MSAFSDVLIIRSATLFHKPFGLSVCVPYSFTSVPGPKNTSQHPTNSTHKFLRFLLFSNRYPSTSTWRWFDLRTVQAEFCLPPLSSGIPEVTAMLCVLGKFPTLTRLVLHQYKTNPRPSKSLREPLNFLLPNVHWSWTCIHFAKTKYRIRETYTFAFDNLTALSFNNVILIHEVAFLLWSKIRFAEVSNNCLTLSKSMFSVVRKLLL